MVARKWLKVSDLKLFPILVAIGKPCLNVTTIC